MVDKEALGRRILEAAYLEGDFVLRSGRRSRYYLDKYLFETQPQILSQLAELFAEHVTDRIDRLAGPELGAVALAAATSLKTGVPFVIVRKQQKDHGTAKRFEGRLEPGERVLLIEDVATTAGAALEAVHALREFGAHVEKLVVVIDRQEGARQNAEAAGFAFDSLFTKESLGI
jgi:orotate phosphoribosyltransferase